MSTLLSEKQSNINPSKDVGIRCYDFQPRPALKSSLKKSSTHPNSLAVSASHIFAAQAEKAVIHVYNREKGNQEAIVPFPEKIKSIALAGDFDGAGVLVLGTEGGRVILWEVNETQRWRAMLLLLTFQSSCAAAVRCRLRSLISSQRHVWRST